MRKFLFILSSFLFCLNLIGQDSTVMRKKFSVPYGIYFTLKSFFAKKPDIEIKFEVFVNKGFDSDDKSAVYGYRLKIADSVKMPFNLFGFFDGNDMFIRVDDGVRGVFPNGYVKEINEYYKLEKPGRHAYFLVSSGPFADLANNHAISMNDVTNNRRINRLRLYYFGKKKKIVTASPSAIGILLKSDEDLYKEYGNEKTINNEVMIKYLDKMNDRYPDWEPSGK